MEIAGLIVLLIVLLGVFARLFFFSNDKAEAVPPSDKTAASLSATSEIYNIAKDIEEYSNRLAHPVDLLPYPAFKRAVALLNPRDYTTQQLLTYYSGSNALVSIMALEALSDRQDDADILEPLLDHINGVSYWCRFFVLRLMNKRLAHPILTEVLQELDFSWLEPIPLQMLKDFIIERVPKIEIPSFGEEVANFNKERVEFLEKLLKPAEQSTGTNLLAELKEWRRTGIDKEFLRPFSQLWDDATSLKYKEIVEHDALLRQVAELETNFLSEKPRSAVVVGEAGVGKSAICNVLANRLYAKGWVIFKAGGSDVMASQMYLGQLEGRLQQLIRNISGKKVLWMVPNFHELRWAGSHEHSRVSVLDMLLPHIEKGAILLLGESHPTAYQQLLQAKPPLRNILMTSHVQPLGDAATLDLARDWISKLTSPEELPLISDQMLREALHLSQQYLAFKAPPGSLLQLLGVTLQRLIASGDQVPQITPDDLIVTLSQLTGLPATILDDRQNLDIQSLRKFFQKRVLGQPEAVDCLVERVVLIKAGMTDPRRPFGVFLFVGPTGTGKTEIAKALAEFLFGSPDRMVRLDMSEFQSPDSLNRILGTEREAESGGALVNAIRNQPFSVVLLDEFEKANPNIWDLFLQVFDDGRLTDRLGRISDFRHSIIIMTSNLGSLATATTAVGFGTKDPSFSAASFQRAVEQTFRREFFNRLDRVLVFRPLSREVMRQLVYKELDEAMQRRGLRNRTWAIEWDDSVIEFLLARGFTPDLGARPLRRAIERHLLSPLALTIVNHQVPQGEQFLLVRSDGHRINVEFIDPNAEEKDFAAGVDAAEVSGETAQRLERIILSPQGVASESHLLQRCYNELAARVTSDAWSGKKQAALAQTSVSHFWESDSRYTVLGLVENMDRVEAGFDTATALLERLLRARSAEKTYFSQKLLQRLAQQIYLLQAACSALESGEAWDAFLSIEAGRAAGSATAMHNQFAKRLGEMYRKWAAKRNMNAAVLHETDHAAAVPYRVLLAMSGYAAYGYLKKERGLHVFEVPMNNKSFQKVLAKVVVAPQPDQPLKENPHDLQAQARAAITAVAHDQTGIVRRYREEPSPLVRDNVSGWRTGRLDLVFDGDFDLIV